MTSRTGRQVAGATLGLALALSFTACKSAEQDTKSGDGASGGVRLTAAQDALAKASAQSSGLTTFRATVALSAGAEGSAATMKGTMAARLEPAPAMRFDVSSLGAGGRKTPGFTEILAGDTVYLKMPGLDRKTGKPWVGLSFQDLSRVSGVDAGETLNRSDPAANVRMLTASKDVRALGTETVGGVSTTHYQGTYDVREGLAKLSDSKRAQAEQSLQRSGIKTMNFDLWVDAQRLPRKLHMTSPPGAATSMDVTTTYTAFNAPLTIKAPPKSQVADGSKLTPPGSGDVPG